MANNIIVKDANSSNVTMKTTETGGVHTASSIPEGEILEILQRIRIALEQISSVTSQLQLYTVNTNILSGTVTIGTGSNSIGSIATVSSVTSIGSTIHELIDVRTNPRSNITIS